MIAHICEVRDLDLADKGLDRIEWALTEMPVVAALKDEFERDRPLEAIHVSGGLRITTETANLARVLVAGGADLVLCAGDPLGTRDDVAAALVARFDIPVFARRGDSPEDYYKRIAATLAHGPQITLDDGADLVGEAHRQGGATLAGTSAAPRKPRRG